MRRKDRELSDSLLEDILIEGEYGVLATVDSHGQPYGVPLSYGYDGESIYFHSAKVGSKLENIDDNNQVSFTVVADVEAVPDKFTTFYKSVIVFGAISRVEGEEKIHGLESLITKYSSDFIKEGDEYIKEMGDKTEVLKVTIQSKTAKGKIK